MFIIDRPYASERLIKAVQRLGAPVLDTPEARELCGNAPLDYLPAGEFGRRLAAGGRLLTNSENGLEQLARVLPDGRESAAARLCKDKVAFREAVSDLYPGFFFKRLRFDQLDRVDPAEFPLPFIIKPAVGFFSIGVHRVDSLEKWPGTLAEIQREMAGAAKAYPESVIGAADFIVEQCAEGEEYAVDAYYDADGNPVILNILHHVFSSADDVSDRIYYTSPGIMRMFLEPMQSILARIGSACGFREFPLHLELRMDGQGKDAVIEANPYRFAGWCVADMAEMAWGASSYEHYMNNTAPDWESVLPCCDGKVFGLVVADLPRSLDLSTVRDIDYDAFLARFEKPLELRRVDWKTYGAFAFLYTETRADNFRELSEIGSADLSEFAITD